MIEVSFRKALPAQAGGPPALTLDIAFAADPRGITALFGRSGSGKTSILKVIAGVFRPDTGRVAVGDRVFFDHDAGIDMRIEDRRLGYVFQEARLFPHLTVRGNLMYGAARARGERRVGLDAAVDLLGIGPLLTRRPHHLSGGERQRVAIGRALLAEPDLLLMDEPLSSLDPPRKAELLPYIESLRDDLGLPILYVSHQINEIVRLADHLVLVDDGRVIRSGPLVEVASTLEMAPLAGRLDAGAVIEARVLSHDDALSLSTLAFTGGRLTVPQREAEPGTRVRVRVRSRDVAIALSEPADISISNRLPGTIRSIDRCEGPYVDVAIDVGGALVRALITCESAQRLRLEPGQQVWALIKSVAFDA